MDTPWTPLSTPPAQLGESPFRHPYGAHPCWMDIAGYAPASVRGPALRTRGDVPGLPVAWCGIGGAL